MIAGGLRRIAGLTVRGASSVARRAGGITGRRLRGKSGGVPILMYHRVLPDDAPVDGIEPGMYVRTSTFEKHVAWLAARYALVTLAEAIDAPRAGRSRPAAVITFDDGWRDNLVEAWPVLERHGARATIFLVADWVEGRSGPGDAFLSPQEVGFLARKGIELGAHTNSHPTLVGTSARLLESELSGSKARVAAWSGRPCRTFAYPFGRFDPQAVAAASRTFEAAVVVGGGWWGGGAPLSRIPRIAIHDDVSRWVPMFEARLAGIV